jgi:cytochrome P450
MSDKNIEKTLRQELRTACCGSSELLQVSEFTKLPYLQACISEALRLYPPITQLRERVVPPEGDTVDGRYIPGGTNIGLNMQALGRHPCFGYEPDQFRPERWLEAGEESLKMMNKVHSLIFGYGSTKCLGINQATMIVTKSVGAVSKLNTYE